MVVSRPEINGKKLGSLHLRNTYGINITRVMRSGVRLLATPGLVLQLGDVLTVVGKKPQIEKVEKVVGNVEVKLKDPNLAAIFIGRWTKSVHMIYGFICRCGSKTGI